MVKVGFVKLLVDTVNVTGSLNSIVSPGDSEPILALAWLTVIPVLALATLPSLFVAVTVIVWPPTSCVFGVQLKFPDVLMLPRDRLEPDIESLTEYVVPVNPEVRVVKNTVWLTFTDALGDTFSIVIDRGEGTVICW